MKEDLTKFLCMAQQFRSKVFLKSENHFTKGREPLIVMVKYIKVAIKL